MGQTTRPKSKKQKQKRCIYVLPTGDFEPTAHVVDADVTSRIRQEAADYVKQTQTLANAEVQRCRDKAKAVEEQAAAQIQQQQAEITGVFNSMQQLQNELAAAQLEQKTNVENNEQIERALAAKQLELDEVKQQLQTLNVEFNKLQKQHEAACAKAASNEADKMLETLKTAMKATANQNLAGASIADQAEEFADDLAVSQLNHSPIDLFLSIKRQFESERAIAAVAYEDLSKKYDNSIRQFEAEKEGMQQKHQNELKAQSDLTAKALAAASEYKQKYEECLQKTLEKPAVVVNNCDKERVAAAECQDELNAVNSDLLSLQQKCNDAEKLREQLQMNRTTLENAKQQHQQELNQCNDEIVKKTNVLRGMVAKAELQDAQKEIAKLEDEINILSLTNKDLNVELTKKQQTITGLETSLAAKSTEVEKTLDAAKVKVAKKISDIGKQLEASIKFYADNSPSFASAKYVLNDKGDIKEYSVIETLKSRSTKLHDDKEAVDYAFSEVKKNIESK